MLYGTIHGSGVSLSPLLSLTPPWLAWCTGGGDPCASLSTLISKIAECGRELAPVFRYVTKDRGERLQVSVS
jgi:hypothetical protein